MSNDFTFRSGQRQLFKYGVASVTVVEIGDMLSLNTSDEEVKPASDFTWNSNLATTQAGFADVFLGIAVEKSASGDTADISVDISADSVYEFAVSSAAYKIGTTLGPAKASGNALVNQTLASAVAASSVARAVFSSNGASVTRLRVKFASVYNPDANTAAGVIG